MVSKLKAGVLLSYLSIGISLLSSIIYTPVMLRTLGQNEFGLYQLAATVINYLGILNLGFGTSYMRIYSKYKAMDQKENIAKLNGMFLIIFVAMSVVILIVGGGLIANIERVLNRSISANDMIELRQIMAILLLNMAIILPGSVLDCNIIAHEEFIFQRMLTIVGNIITPCCTIPILFLNYGARGLVWIIFAVNLLKLIISFWFCIKKTRMRFAFHSFELGIFREMSIFTFWVFINNIVDQINWGIDKFLLGIYSGTIAVAIYGVASQINSMYLTLSLSLSNVFVPRVNTIIAEDSSDSELTDLFIKIGRIQFLVMSLILSGFFFFGKTFIYFWAGSEYDLSYRVALLLIAPVTIPAIQNIGIEIQRAKNKHKARSIAYSVIAVSNLFVSIYCIKLYGIIGAAVGTALTFILGNGLFMNWYYYKKIGINIPFFWREIISLSRFLLLPISYGIIWNAFMPEYNFFTFIAAILSYTLIFFGSAWRWGLNAFEKRQFRSLVKKTKQI